MGRFASIKMLPADKYSHVNEVIRPTTTARLTSRKFMLVFKIIEPPLWRDIVIALLGGYLTSDVVQKVMAAKAGTA